MLVGRRLIRVQVGVFHLASRFAAESRAAWTDFALICLHIRDFVNRNVQTNVQIDIVPFIGEKEKGNRL